jgi:hypothetical protein
MIRFACPACNAVMNASDNKVGLKVSCLHCGQRLQIPGPPRGTVLATSLPTTQSASTKALSGSGSAVPAPAPEPKQNAPKEWFSRKKTLVVLGGCVGLLAILTVGVLVTAALLPLTGNGPLAGPPSTCREVAERLQARGMAVRWTNSSGPYPAIFIVKRGTAADGWLENLDNPDVYPGVCCWVIVEQLPEEKEAQEKAGAMSNGFAWGRFLFYGDKDLVEDIKKHL